MAAQFSERSEGQQRPFQSNTRPASTLAAFATVLLINWERKLATDCLACFLIYWLQHVIDIDVAGSAGFESHDLCLALGGGAQQTLSYTLVRLRSYVIKYPKINYFSSQTTFHRPAIVIA